METLTTSIAKCSTCNESLNVKGECLACLLRGGLNGSVEESVAERDSLVFSDFEIARREDGSFWELGSGAMGVTYRATDKVLHRTVALKVIETPAAAGDSKAVRERFLREARAAAALKHPNVAGIFQFGASPEIDRCYYAMELVEGETLEALVRRDGPLKPEQALEIAIQVTRALVAAAAQGLIHRDLKPGNIMITRADAETVKLEVKVIDFGLAKVTNAVGEADLTHGGFVGTPSFASPEQFSGAPADARSDIYSLGVTLWYSLTGQVPYPGKTIEEIRDRQQRTDLPMEQLVARKIATPLIEMLRRTLAIDPTQRPASARELMEALESCRTKLVRRSGIWSFWKLAAVVVVLGILTAAASWIVWKTEFIRHPLTTGIAVLPFENLSDDPDNAYFANGIQEEILTRLASIADLKVISRTSTQQYQSKPRNLREIAKQLGVANILEGSVQKAADQVRVNVQLINAQTDSHLWADTYDRKFTDILGVESEIAKRIAESLQAKLTGREEQALTVKPTENPKAYDAYLRGLSYSLRTQRTPANSLGAQKYLREAVQLDPKFALAWALLSYTNAVGYHTMNLQPTVPLGEETRQAAETALTLQPALGEAVLAKGYYHYACLKDYNIAVRYLEQAHSLLPNNSRILQSLADVERTRGQWDRSDAFFNEAERLDPRNVLLFTQHALSLIVVRRFPEAVRRLDQVLDITPDDVDTSVIKATIAQAEGDMPRAAALLAPLHPNAHDFGAWEIQTYQAILERQPISVIPRLKEILAEPDTAFGFFNGELRFWLGWAQQVAGDHAAAQESWRQTRSELEPLLKEQPQNAELISVLALANMGLGDKVAALALAEQAMAASPVEKDAVNGPFPLEILARVAAQTGGSDRAIAALQKLLSTPYEGPLASRLPLTPALLRLDPMFDPLRNNPRFQELILAPIPNLSK